MSYNKYNEQKDSNIQWVGDIPTHWIISKIKHNFSFSKSTNTSLNPTILSLTLQGIKIRDISTNEGQIASSYDNYTKVFKNDIVLNPMDLISGFVDCSPVEGVISPAYYTLKPNKCINPNYYKYYLQKHYYEKIFFPFAEGVSVDHRWTLKKEDFLNFSLIKPPIDEQKQIANYLDKKTSKIDTTIAKNKELIDLLEEKRTALINQVVTKGLNQDVPIKGSEIEWIGEIPEHWDVRKLKYLTSKIGSGKTPKGGSEIYVSEGIPLLRSQNIHFDSVRWDDVVYITDEINKTMWSTIVKNHDVLLNITGASIGRCNYIENIDIANVNQHVCIIRPNKTIFYKYLNYFLQSECGQNQVFLNQNGTSREGLNFEDLSNFDIILPDYEEQIKIVSFIDNEIKKIYSTISKINDSITLLEEYKTSLIHHVVTGKIDVRGEEI